MIVIAGGSGRLGRILAERFLATGERVRVLSRSGAPAAGKLDVIVGDARDPAAAERAVRGARIVVSAMSAFGMKGVAPRQVDFEGNVNLIAAAEKHGVERFILVSARGASPRHAMELSRMKYLAERRLIQSKVGWAILRPSTFIETFQEILCAPLLENRKAVVFGRAQNLVNFVSAHDVARFVELAASDSGLAGAVTDIGGAENLSLVQFVEVFGSALGVASSVKHVPRLALRLLSLLARPFHPTFARMAQAAVVMDTTEMSFDATELRQRFPQIPLTTVAASARRDYGSFVATQVVTP